MPHDTGVWGMNDMVKSNSTGLCRSDESIGVVGTLNVTIIDSASDC